MRSPILATGIFLTVTTLMVGCGAPLKNADDVEHIFSKTRDLETKVNDLCATLRSRQEAPNFGNFRIADELCAKPGGNYLNFQDLSNHEALRFAAVRSSSESVSTRGLQNANAVFNMQTRTQLFLNKSVLQLAKTLLTSLDQRSKKLGSNQGTSKDEKFHMEFIGDPVFDAKNFSFQAEFRMTSKKSENGQVDIDNVYSVRGSLINDEAIAVDIATKDSGDVAQTIIRDGKILMFMIPHARDIYMEIGTDINYHSFGVDAVMKQSILSTLGSGLRTLPELVVDADKES